MELALYLSAFKVHPNLRRVKDLGIAHILFDDEAGQRIVLYMIRWIDSLYKPYPCSLNHRINRLLELARDVTILDAQQAKDLTAQVVRQAARRMLPEVLQWAAKQVSNDKRHLERALNQVLHISCLAGIELELPDLREKVVT
jgi:chromosomal replication initiation ATPase DnaA